MPSLIASSFCDWKSLPFLMNTVYSTTISPEPYPKVLIVDGEPALAVDEPERLVVIPTFAFTPVKFDPSIAGRVPVKFAAGKLVSDAPEPLKVVAVKVPEEFKLSLYEPPV